VDPVMSSLLAAPLVPLGCLTLPRQVPLPENQITAYDCPQPLLGVAGRSLACGSIQWKRISAMPRGTRASGFKG
jgi:hypothetical protein